MNPGQQQQPEVDEKLRHALAIAIVRNKRRCVAEVAQLKAQAARLEADLQRQQEQHAKLQRWATTVLKASDASGGAAEALGRVQDQHAEDAGIFLPPLTVPQHAAQLADASQLQGCYRQLQQQLLLSATATAGSAAVTDVLQGRAAALSGMLLHNMHMVQLLHKAPAARHLQTQLQLHYGTKQGISNNSNSGVQSFAQGTSAAALADVAGFIMGTLLHAPKSSLSTAYMQQCAALIAAILTAQPAPEAPPAAAAGAGACGLQQACDNPEALAVQVVGLMQELLQTRAVGDPFLGSLYAAASRSIGNAPEESATGRAGGGSSSYAKQGAAAAAAVMLQQLSTFPATALLLGLAVTQELMSMVQQLQEANAVMASVSLATLSGTNMQALQHASAIAAAAFQGCAALLTELEGAVQQLPAWGVALAGNCWAPSALEDLASTAGTMYSICPALQQQQPLMAARLCSLVANVATALQQLAANADAPGMRAGPGAELRAVAGALCRKLRDLFMPAVQPQQHC